MIKKIQMTLLAVLIMTMANAQTTDLIFDNTFNNNSPSSDFLPVGLDNVDFGGMKQLNDSMFVYYRNVANWQSYDVFSDVDVKTIQSNGTVTVENIYSNQRQFTSNYDPGIFAVTDVVTSGSRIFIISNEGYDDNGTFKNGIHIESYDYMNGSFAPSSWGSGSIQPTANIINAKASMLGNNIVLVFNQGIQIAMLTVGSFSGMITHGPPTMITNNINTERSGGITDVLVVSSTEMYIVDNAYTYTSSNGISSYNDLARIIKYNPSTFSLSLDYNAAGTGFSASMNWNNQSNTPFNQNFIRSISYVNGKLLVAGYSNEYDGSQYAMGRGRITRLNANGSIDATFAPNSSISGTFATSFVNNYARWWFSDLDVKSDGNLFVSAYGNYGNSPDDDLRSFFLQLDSVGNLDTSLGNNGRLFEDPTFGEIKETIIIPGNSTLLDKFVFSGLQIQDPILIVPISEVTMGRLKWNNSSNPTALIERQESLIKYYPNPASTYLNIEVEEATEIRIVSLVGKTIATRKLQAGNNSLDLSELASGVYLIQSENGTSRKFVKSE